MSNTTEDELCINEKIRIIMENLPEGICIDIEKLKTDGEKP